ncbi:MAG: type II toxin-antitoxin system VapC family toxin [Cyanobacteriota bacterium]|nr:type II toxin-antitoxin system VapC family toxin [Cyanobacteriota bacterium]
MGDRQTTALLVVDTDVLIDYLRDQADAVAFLEGCAQPLSLSVVSVAELYVGVRDGEERRRLDAFTEAFDALPLAQEAAVQAGLWRRQYGRSHGTGLADALIAASVAAAGGTLATLNRRHFPMLTDVLVPYAKP